jgi:hypothetical protein
MATTTNYAWETPDDTDLVKDGALAIRTLGSSIDTTTKALNPSTTLGDIEYRSSTANTNTRLGIGSTGQVLTVAGGVPTWAAPASGSLTLINTGGTALSGASTTVTLSGTYKNLYIEIDGFYGANLSFMMMQFNSDTTQANYFHTGTRATGGTAATFAFNPQSLISADNVQNSSASATNKLAMYISNYSSTTQYKTAQVSQIHNVNATDIKTAISTYGWKNTAAITSIKVLMDSGNLSAGTIYVYGVN